MARKNQRHAEPKPAALSAPRDGQETRPRDSARDALPWPPAHDYLDFEPGEALDQLIGASIHYRIAIGPNAGKKALILRTVPAQPEPFASTLLARQPGFSRHAVTRCEANQRDQLEKLCRDINRPAIANERLSMSEREKVIVRFKQPFRDGATQVVLDPLDFIVRFAALVPRPRLNLTRFHGVWGANSNSSRHW